MTKSQIATLRTLYKYLRGALSGKSFKGYPSGCLGPPPSDPSLRDYVPTLTPTFPDPRGRRVKKGGFRGYKEKPLGVVQRVV